MIALIQRVKRSSVETMGRITGSISNGLNILLGVGNDDSLEDANYLASKIAALRIFSDDNGRMNLSIQDVGGSALVISQFTLHADCRKGNRPSFTNSAEPELARQLYEAFIDLLSGEHGIHVETGIFAADMTVEIINDGPVTIILDSNIRKKPRRND